MEATKTVLSLQHELPTSLIYVIVNGNLIYL
jgi:hypothetical protein